VALRTTLVSDSFSCLCALCRVPVPVIGRSTQEPTLPTAEFWVRAQRHAGTADRDERRQGCRCDRRALRVPLWSGARRALILPELYCCPETSGLGPGGRN